MSWHLQELCRNCRKRWRNCSKEKEEKPRQSTTPRASKRVCLCVWQRCVLSHVSWGLSCYSTSVIMMPWFPVQSQRSSGDFSTLKTPPTNCPLTHTHAHTMLSPSMMLMSIPEPSMSASMEICDEDTAVVYNWNVWHYLFSCSDDGFGHLLLWLSTLVLWRRQQKKSNIN